MKLLALFLTLLSATSAWAHNIWLEDTADGQVVVRFGEYGEEFEKSPGALDSIFLPVAWMNSEEGKVVALEVLKKSDHFLLAGATGKSPVQMETSSAVRGTPGDSEKPVSKPLFYARWHVPGTQPGAQALTLDIVPSATAGEATVFFRGKPLGGVKLKFHPPEGAAQDLTSDESGRVRFTVAKAGFYMLAARQRETVPGFSSGKAYEVASYNCSLAWRQR